MPGKRGGAEECKLKTSSSTGLSCPNAASREGCCFLCRELGQRVTISMGPVPPGGTGEGHAFITPWGSEEFCWAVEVAQASLMDCVNLEAPGQLRGCCKEGSGLLPLLVFKPSFSLTEN